MSISNFLYRQKQKIKYHTAATDLDRLLAEINRNDELVELGESTFKLKELNFIFPNKYLFLLERYDDLVFLLKQNNSSFELIEKKLIYKINNLKLLIKTAEELFIIKEVYFHQIYNIRIGNTFNVIDVGMNVGFTSLYFASRSDVKNVYSYEPFKVTFDDAQENFDLNKEIHEKIERQNIGLGLRNETIEVEYSSELKGKNTTKNRIEVMTERQEIDSIELVNAKDEIVKVINKSTSHRFVIKLDCEGAEYDIFNSFGSNRFPENIVAFMIEWHKNEPQPLIEKLINNDFKVHCKYDSKEIGFILAIR